MTEGEQLPPPPEEIYNWEEGVVPTEVLQLWEEVGTGIERNQTVVWKSAVESLDHAHKYLRCSKEARSFAEKYMPAIISILSEQQPSKIDDLEIQNERNGPSTMLNVLGLTLNRKKAFYKGAKGNWNVNHMQGCPEARLKCVERFRACGGVKSLHRYMVANMETQYFPKLDTVHHILTALYDTLVPTRAPPAADARPTAKELEEDAILISNDVMNYISRTNEDALKKISTDLLLEIQADLQKIFDRLISTRRQACYDFYDFWRALALKLIQSQSLPLKLFGWEQISQLIEASLVHRPPPKSYIVSNAGCTFVNGIYHFAGVLTPDGFARPGCEISYTMKIPDGAPNGGKKLTLFRCTMRSQQKWWFLSEADEEQPGTDRDIDYYQHKSKEHEEGLPPPGGWLTCRTAGIDPPPTLESKGLLVPKDQEFETLDHQLAKWAIENQIVQQVLGDTTIHREVVARSTVLIKFLASMCDRYPPVGEMTDGPEPKRYCLQPSHLLFAWKTCLRKADAVVSSQVYQLLVSILPLCPVELANPLLKAVQTSLHDSHETRDHLFEVSEFCSALASGNLVVDTGGATPVLKDEVREEALNLLWSVLTHRDASSLRSYDNLKRYVLTELRVEPKGTEHREKFLRSSVLSITEAIQPDAVVDEAQALRMVKLTHFVLESCPRDQADTLIRADGGAIPRLLFEELVAYLRRRKSPDFMGFIDRKPSTISQSSAASAGDSDGKRHLDALNVRTSILRSVYGLQKPQEGDPGIVAMTFPMIESLWQLCDDPEDREPLMYFLASASTSGQSQYSGQATVYPSNADQMLCAAFPQEVVESVFLQLFCAPSMSYERLGKSGHRSFQYLFTLLCNSQTISAKVNDVALDALWRLCLTAADDSVASPAMLDLLNVYATKSTIEKNDSVVVEQMATDEKEDSFGERIIQCLTRVKEEREAGTETSSLSAERCLLILNAAIGQSDGRQLILSTIMRMSMLGPNATLAEVLNCLPHGMRGQACYRRVSVVVRRSQSQNQAQGSGSNGRSASTLKFSLDLHPLETLASVKERIAVACQCPIVAVKPVQINGRAQYKGTRSDGNIANGSLSLVPQDTVVDELGIVEGCELVFVVSDKPLQTVGPENQTRSPFPNDLSNVFFGNERKFSDRLFGLLMSMLKSLKWQSDEMTDSDDASVSDLHKLIWEFLLAMPTNSIIATRVKLAHARSSDDPSMASEDDAMEVDSAGDSWQQLLDIQSFDRSVYVLLTIDGFLRPAVEVVSTLPEMQRSILQREMKEDAAAFRRSFVEAGGFEAVVRFFSASETNDNAKRGKTRRGNAVALRILKSCLFGDIEEDAVSLSVESDDVSVAPDEIGAKLLKSLSDTEGLLKSLTLMVIDDPGISSGTLMDVLRFLRLLFQSPLAAKSFVDLPNNMAKMLLIIPLLREESESNRSGSISAAMHVRKSAHDLVLQTQEIADKALPWLVTELENIDVSSECTNEYFDVLENLVADTRSTARSGTASEVELRELCSIVCKKIVSCPRPTSESDAIDFSTSVLCGCLRLLRALIESGVSTESLRPGIDVLVTESGVPRWSTQGFPRSNDEDEALIDLMGAIFDGYLSPGGPAAVAICCDRDSRHVGFDVIGAAARSCKGSDGYMALVGRINGLVEAAAPHLRHRFGQFGGGNDSTTRTKGSSKYSGLRNQGCTCYMNSFLQQLFMMTELRRSMCSAPIPSCLRSSGRQSSHGPELVGKKISLQWENGVAYDAMVESFDGTTGMHCIRYCPMVVATSGGQSNHQIDPSEIERLPSQLLEEFVLSEGRPTKETGVFEIVKEATEIAGQDSQMEAETEGSLSEKLQETEDEAASRHLLEEVQRTFIHLDEGSRGRCFDPKGLVEASGCLKLEFDVWQQNDASEFATKLLDRLEISLKKWAPNHFRYMDHTFGLKQTKQKICRECGLKTNREEKLLNIDCQIRGKTDIQEALAAMTEVEIMEGSNKVFCDRCKKNTDTILRTALSTLPNMLILSLKRFDLDFTTFETVKLNSRCAFGQTLNLKRYTLEGLESMEKSHKAEGGADPSPMETDDEGQDGELSGAPDVERTESLDDEDYEYRLAGVLVHAGVAQGGHYYSFIQDRSEGSDGKWYRFDDEDVTPFDPASIEAECFGGKVKKETKWPNGQVHTVEQEQFANALMLFYEKVKPTALPDEASKDDKMNVPVSTGYDVFKADVKRSNATHRWQSFLFDSEFQNFLKGLLGILHRDALKQNDAMVVRPDVPWQQPVLQMLTTFFFDVMLHGSDRSGLEEWTTMLEDTLHSDLHSSIEFVNSIAMKTRAVSSNWLRTYLLDCPDVDSRMASVRIFVAAISACLSSSSEAAKFGKWIESWEEQVQKIASTGTPAPCSLQGQMSVLEDIMQLETGMSTSVGIIVSFVNLLLESINLQWQYGQQVLSFVLHLAALPDEAAGDLVRRALVASLVSARLVALAVRERLHPSYFRLVFPGSSVSQEVANTQMRPESSHSPHVMQIGGNHGMHGSDVNVPKSPNPYEYNMILEALACIGGLPGCRHVSLVQEGGEFNRRRRYVLTDAATDALKRLFEDVCPPGAPGLGRREIEQYLSFCGVETSQLSSQKILDMLAKYPTTGGTDEQGAPYLSLEGFLAYYRDSIQNGDARLRQDLQIYGFRPDLTRRSQTARILTTGERAVYRLPEDSIAQDVAEVLGDKPADFGLITDACLHQTFDFFGLAFSISDTLGYYLVAGAAHKKDCGDFIDRILLAIHNNHSWNGDHSLGAPVEALKIIASLPGEEREARITRIMESSFRQRDTDHQGVGLIQFLRYMNNYRNAQPQHAVNTTLNWHYSRYIEVVRSLRKIAAVNEWLSEHRSSWAFMERDLLERIPQQMGHQMRGDYGSRDGVAGPIDHHGHSDSDVGGMNDSDEDSHYEHDSRQLNDGPYLIVVEGAGNSAVNGLYRQDGHFQDACRYRMSTSWNGQRSTFYIFQCNVSNNTKHWYISIVPENAHPGTSSDIDFYTAPVSEECRNVPPTKGWVKASQNGVDPAPILIHRHKDDVNGPEGIWNGTIEEDENQSPYL